MRRLIRSSIVALYMTVFTTCAVAATTVPNTFTAGTPAKAADVNANFQALATAIDTLSARVDKLDGTTPVTMADLAGTYVINGLQMGSFKSVSTPQGWIDNYTYQGTLTLVADGNGTLSNTETGNRFFPSLNPGVSPDYIASFNPTISSYTLPSNQGFTWSLSGGSITIPTLGGSFTIVSGGRLLIKSTSDSTTGTSVLLLLTRTN